eukprot:804644_1
MAHYAVSTTYTTLLLLLTYLIIFKSIFNTNYHKNMAESTIIQASQTPSNAPPPPAITHLPIIHELLIVFAYGNHRLMDKIMETKSFIWSENNVNINNKHLFHILKPINCIPFKSNELEKYKSITFKIHININTIISKYKSRINSPLKASINNCNTITT